MEFGKNKGDLTINSEPFSEYYFPFVYQNSDQSEMPEPKFLTQRPLSKFCRIPLEKASKTKQTHLLELDGILK